MPQQKTGDFCSGFRREKDGRISFECSADVDAWPWLRLHPADNIAVQSTNYYSLTGVSLFAGTMDGDKWTALTEFRWRTFNSGADTRHPVRGVADTRGEDGIGYACDFFDGDGAQVYAVSGAGVVFRNRDFKAWREKAKAEVLTTSKPKNFVYAPPEDVGVSSAVESIVTPLRREGGALFVEALVTADNGFPPAHPYYDGSGDHVNSTHLTDAAQQMARLLRLEAGKGGHPIRGVVAFKRYVELERSFRISLAYSHDDLTQISLQFEQAGRPCANLSFDYAD